MVAIAKWNARFVFCGNWKHITYLLVIHVNLCYIHILTFKDNFGFIGLVANSIKKMNENKKEDLTKKDQDDELSNLLESALQDFNKPVESDKKIENESNQNSCQVSENFIQEALTQFEADFANLLSAGSLESQISPEFVQQKLQQMAEAANQVVSNPNMAINQNNSSDIATSISQAVQGLTEGAEGLQNPFSEEDLMKMFGQSGEGNANDFVPFMQGMMQGLLSKEVLGPSLQDFVARFPAYLEENKDKLSLEDKERYTKQKDLMEEVLQELNKEKDTDTAQAKNDRFTKVLGLMQKLQDYGHPPTELTGSDFETPFKFDAQGNPDSTECSIM